MWSLKVPLEGSMSQIVHLGPSSHFMSKKRVTFCHFFISKFLHFIKQKLRPESTF